MKNNPLPRIDIEEKIREKLLPFCRLQTGDIWVDTTLGHKVGCLDAASSLDISKLLTEERATLAVHDPPYNLIAFQEQSIENFMVL